MSLHIGRDEPSRRRGFVGDGGQIFSSHRLEGGDLREKVIRERLLQIHG
jgi:hypothetical protein